MVKDIYPGVNSSIQFTELKVTNLINVKGVLYFYADDGIHGLELWKSDGTSTGTVLVNDLRPGIEGSTPSNLTVVNGILYFTADDGIHGIAVWKLISPYTWTGTISADWKNPANWSSGIVPTINDDVVIPPGKPFLAIIYNAFTGHCKSMMIKPGAKLTVATGGDLKVGL